MGYIYAWEHHGGGGHIDVACSSIFEDLYSLEIDIMDTCASSVFPLFLLDHRFLDAPTHITVRSRLALSVGNIGLFCSHALDHVGCIQIYPKLFKSIATGKQVLKNNKNTIENIDLKNKAIYLLFECSRIDSNQCR